MLRPVVIKLYGHRSYQLNYTVENLWNCADDKCSLQINKRIISGTVRSYDIDVMAYIKCSMGGVLYAYLPDSKGLTENDIKIELYTDEHNIPIADNMFTYVIPFRYCPASSLEPILDERFPLEIVPSKDDLNRSYNRQMLATSLWNVVVAHPESFDDFFKRLNRYILIHNSIRMFEDQAVEDERLDEEYRIWFGNSITDDRIIMLFHPFEFRYMFYEYQRLYEKTEGMSKFWSRVMYLTSSRIPQWSTYMYVGTNQTPYYSTGDHLNTKFYQRDFIQHIVNKSLELVGNGTKKCEMEDWIEDTFSDDRIKNYLMDELERHKGEKKWQKLQCVAFAMASFILKDILPDTDPGELEEKAMEFIYYQRPLIGVCRTDKNNRLKYEWDSDIIKRKQ